MIAKRLFLLGFFGSLLLLPISLFANELQPLDSQSIPKSEVFLLKIASITELDSDGQMSGFNIVNMTGETASGPIQINSFTVPVQFLEKLNTNSKIYVSKTTLPEGDVIYNFVDIDRSFALQILAFIFITLVFLVSGKKGLASLISLFLSFFFITQYTIPNILLGKSALLVSVITILAVVPLGFYLSHGFSLKTHISALSTFVTLLFTGAMSIFFVNLASISGYAQESVIFVQALQDNAGQVKNLIIAGFFIAIVGILDDVTISQVAIVESLKKNAQNLSGWKLFQEAMIIGKDHIASLVNTLVLVYFAASLPLFLLFQERGSNLALFVNDELVATEILRSLIASIGVILAVPISTFFATWIFSKKNHKS